MGKHNMDLGIFNFLGNIIYPLLVGFKTVLSKVKVKFICFTKYLFIEAPGHFRLPLKFHSFIYVKPILHKQPFSQIKRETSIGKNLV